MNDLPIQYEPDYNTDAELRYKVDIQDYFENSVGTCLDKLQSFPRFVPRQTLTTFFSKYELFKKILCVQGSVIECGVYMGGGLMTFAQISAILEPVNFKRRIIGFDTFCGFTEPEEQDIIGKSIHSKAGEMAADSYDDLKRCFELFDANRFLGHIPKVALVKGDIRETAPQYLKDNPHTVVSLLYLDADLYAPTRVAIETFLPRMPKGSIIAFDELEIPLWPGETAAVEKSIGIKNLRIARFPFAPHLCYSVIE